MVPCPGMHIKGARPGVTQTNTKNSSQYSGTFMGIEAVSANESNQMRMLLDKSLKPSLRGPRNSRHYKMNTASEKKKKKTRLAQYGKGQPLPVKAQERQKQKLKESKNRSWSYSKAVSNCLTHLHKSTEATWLPTYTRSSVKVKLAWCHWQTPLGVVCTKLFKK